MNAVWPKGLSERVNTLVSFQYKHVPTKECTLKIAASNLYRLHINGKFVGYGPARAARGYSRIDSYALDPSAERFIISVEVYSANIGTYYTVKETPFFAAELYESDTIVAEAKDFIAHLMTERVQKVYRYSFQRAFTEH